MVKVMNALTPDTDQLLDTKDTAALLNLSPSTVNKMRMTKDGPPYYKLGHRVTYKRSEVFAWLESKRFLNTSQYSLADEVVRA
jgi:predicted DNA-binding transcriptional regulator AlpA